MMTVVMVIRDDDDVLVMVNGVMMTVVMVIRDDDDVLVMVMMIVTGIELSPNLLILNI